MVYNHHENVAAITSFYEFLIRVHIDESDVERLQMKMAGFI